MGSDDGRKVDGWVTLQRDGWAKGNEWEARRQRASKQASSTNRGIMKSFQFHPPTQSRFYPDLMSSNYCYLKIPSTNDILEFQQPPYLPPSTHLLLSLCHVRRNVDKVRRRQQTP